MKGLGIREVNTANTTKLVPEDKQKVDVKKKVVVEIMKPKGFNKKLYVPPQLRTEESDKEELENNEALLRDQEDLMDPLIKNMVVQPGQIEKDVLSKNVDPVTKRPFDKVDPIQRDPIPSNQALNKEKNDLLGKVRNANKERDKVKVPENAIIYKETAKKVGNFRNASTLSKPGLEEEIAEKIFNLDITIPVGDLMAVSPGIRAVILRKARNKRVVERAEQAFLQLEASENDLNPIGIDGEVEAIKKVDVDDIWALKETFLTLTKDTGELKAGTIVHQDVVEQFLKDLGQSNKEKVILVARESEGLRVVFPKINHSDETVEAVLDSGSQIISMDHMVAMGLGLSWDPDIVIHMQSANGSLKPTKGMARNVPFVFGDLTVYLQVHVVESAPYQVLLGRPFDVNTQSVIKNFEDGGQELTLTDLNNGHKCTIGTYVRGKGVRVEERKEPTLREMGSSQSDSKENEKEIVNFQTSMI